MIFLDALSGIGTMIFLMALVPYWLFALIPFFLLQTGKEEDKRILIISSLLISIVAILFMIYVVFQNANPGRYEDHSKYYLMLMTPYLMIILNGMNALVIDENK